MRHMLTILALWLVPISGALARSADVAYANIGVPLAAELIVPDVTHRVPAVVIVHGSGASDRSNSWARVIADALVANGVAALLTDKRGSGKSGGDWRTAGFHELADDALAGVELLKGRPEIDASRIGLVGLSQGGRIVPIAASKSSDVAFVISLVSDAVTFPEQSNLEMANTARQANLGREDAEKVVALNTAAGRFLVGGDWEGYQRLRQDMLRGPAAAIAKAFPAERSATVWTFLRKVVAYDPLPYWMVSTQPALLVFGEKDELDNVPVAESVRRLNFAFAAANKRNAQVTVLPGLGHSLMSEGRRLAPSFSKTLSEWLRLNVTRAHDHSPR
jgi:pimeloyl-ACP methyl ester carboxylesterase